MPEQSWNEARLIPTSGINGAEEQERRATSALLAVMTSVKEFGRTVLQPMGAPVGKVEAYIEVPFDLQGRRVYPDGLVRVSRGQRSWTALVEVKTGKNELAADQLGDYLDVAKEQGFDCLITISNQIPALPGQHPTEVDRRKLRKVPIHHLSWSRLLTDAVIQKEHRGIADPDQAWILGELIRYLEHPKSGALQFDDMGSGWVTVREAVTQGIARPGDKELPEVASRFDALLRYVSLQLGRQLGSEVVPQLTRAELNDPAARSSALVRALCERGILYGGVRIPDTAGPLGVEVDLRAKQVTCFVDIDAPREGRPRTRVNWLVRQLKQAPPTVRIEAHVMRTRGAGAAELLSRVREDPDLLVPESGREIKSFRVALATPMGLKRGVGRGSFIDSVADGVNAFYGDVLQNLKPWAPAPPKLRSIPGEGVDVLSSTALSSQDDAATSTEPADAAGS